MGKLRWYKRDPVAALEGMSELTLEERGAYNTVLDLIYARDGKIDDDDRFIAGWLRSDVRVWRRIKARLIGLKKLYIEDGSVRNSRADAEVDRGLSMVASASDAGKASAAKRERERNKNNYIDVTTVDATVSTISTPTTRKKEPSLRSGTRGTRMTADALISPEDRQFAIDLGVNPDKAWPEFVDFWIGVPGQRGCKTNWSATWRNRVRAIVEKQGPRHGKQSSNSRTDRASGPSSTGADAILAGMGRLADRVAARGAAARPEDGPISGGDDASGKGDAERGAADRNGTPYLQLDAFAVADADGQRGPRSGDAGCGDKADDGSAWRARH